MTTEQAPPERAATSLRPVSGRDQTGSLRLVPLTPDVLRALLRADLKTASDLTGVTLTAYFVEHHWLWRIRLAQLEHDPSAAGWIARAAVDQDTVVGHVGFHGPPDGRGTVEVAYSVEPDLRRRGYATKMLAAALRWASQDPRVRVVRATVGPDNEASLSTLAAFSFELVGEQWDDEDGLELVHELHLTTPHAG